VDPQKSLRDHAVFYQPHNQSSLGSASICRTNTQVQSLSPYIVQTYRHHIFPLYKFTCRDYKIYFYINPKNIALYTPHGEGRLIQHKIHRLCFYAVCSVTANRHQRVLTICFSTGNKVDLRECVYTSCPPHVPRPKSVFILQSPADSGRYLSTYIYIYIYIYQQNGD
jgi:hypothetical protein